jgi:deoxyribonucleoside regulator
MVSIQRKELLAQVAAWYYQYDESLSTIAKRVDRSISMVSRMLKEARESGLVEIRIRYPLATDPDAEHKLAERYGMRRAHVFAEPSGAPAQPGLDRFSALCAATLGETLSTARTIGVSWGTHVHAVVKAMSATGAADGVVAQCSGAVPDGDPAFDGARISQHLAATLGYRARLLHAPLVVDTPEVAQALRESQTVSEVLEQARKADVLLLGLGSPFDETSGLRRAGYLSPSDLQTLRGGEAVGDILGYHLDREGRVLDIDLNRRIISLEPSALAAIPNVVVVATGVAKVEAIRACLAAGYIDTLATDGATARHLLQ